MTATIEVAGPFAQSYPQLCEYVLNRGTVTAPRNLSTYEIIAPTLRFVYPEQTLLVGCGRKLNLRFAAVEALQLIGGFHDPDLMRRALPAVDAFANTGVFHGAYGTRIGPQMVPMVNKLRSDASSRQAIIQIWDWPRDLAQQAFTPRDLPCTLFFQFFLRDNALQMHAVMRSNDVWKGLSYDAFQFAQLYWSVHNALWRGNLGVGGYYHHPMSLHAYATDVEAMRALRYEGDVDVPKIAGVGHPGMSMREIQQRAQCIARGTDLLDATSSERWYIEQIGKM